jgi:DNA-binding NtrC family response regulator
MSSAETEFHTLKNRPAPVVQLKTIGVTILAGPDAGLVADFCLPSIRLGTADDNDVVLSDGYVSRHHLELRMTVAGPMLRDLWSTNGLFLNDKPVTELLLDAEETVVRVGESRIAFRQKLSPVYSPVPAEQSQLGDLVGSSARMREVFGLIRAAAPTQATILINGPSGSGKELVARALHQYSGRTGPFVVFDASVADQDLMRNDLFGHVKGAFTSAVDSREGAFRRANGGTLFIDEIGELPLELQPRLLRVLESREVTAVGSDKPVRVDVRVVAATHRDLWAMVQAGTFRADLFYRLSVLQIRTPPLRDIREDLPLMVESLLKKLSINCRVSADAMDALRGYHWPGNVRELRNVLERAGILCGGGTMRPEHLGLELHSAPSMPVSAQPGNPPEPMQAAPSSATMKDIEREVILEALARNQNNVDKTARDLGISYSTLRRRIKSFNI